MLLFRFHAQDNGITIGGTLAAEDCFIGLSLLGFEQAEGGKIHNKIKVIKWYRKLLGVKQKQIDKVPKSQQTFLTYLKECELK